MAWLSTPALLGPVLGPPIGGFIVDYFSWRAIFDVNIPMGIEAGLAIVVLAIILDRVCRIGEAPGSGERK